MTNYEKIKVYIAAGVCWHCRRKKMCPSSSRGVQCSELAKFKEELFKEELNGKQHT